MSQAKELYVAFGEAVGAGERSLGKRLTEGDNRLAWEFFLAGAKWRRPTLESRAIAPPEDRWEVPDHPGPSLS